MKCQECELLLAQGEPSPAVEEHVRECRECRALQQEFADNAAALSSLREEAMPVFAFRRPRRAWYAWAGVAAALILVAAAGVEPQFRHAPKPEPRTPAVAAVHAPVAPLASTSVPAPRAEAIARIGPAPLRPRKPQTLKIKMLTSDPEVVIYWLVED